MSDVIQIPAKQPERIENDYVLYADDFVFEPFKQQRKSNGDSGKLLLATSKADESVKYVVKYQHISNICNEFMYRSVASAFGVYMPEVKLIQVTPNFLFHQKVAVGIHYVPDAAVFSKDMKKSTDNRRDFIAFETLFVILNEEDSHEYYIDGQARLFKLDNSASFNLDDSKVNGLLQYEQMDDTSRSAIDYLVSRALDYTADDYYRYLCKAVFERDGRDARDICLDVFSKFATFDETVIDDALRALALFFPERLCDYYHEFIYIRKSKCAEFLNKITSDSSK